MAHNKNSAAHQEFLKYKVYILEKFLDKFGKSYDTTNTMKKCWFHEYEYSISAEEFLIDESKLYLRLCPHCREIKFLNALTNYMADYLSQYTMRHTQYTSDDAKRAGRKAEKQKLKSELYTKNKYIQQLVYNTTKQQLLYPNSRSSEMHRQRAKTDRIRRDYETHKQVAIEFIEAGQLRPKR